MIINMFKKIFGTKAARDLRRMRPLVDRVNELEEEYQKLSEEQLKAKTGEFKERLKNGETLDDIMCEAFAVVKNACRRNMGQPISVCDQAMTWEMIPYDVQVLGAIALHRGNIAEMATGEGKTLVATMPLYLNALTRTVGYRVAATLAGSAGLRERARTWSEVWTRRGEWMQGD